MITTRILLKTHELRKAAGSKTRVRCPACNKLVEDVFLHALEIMDKDHVVLTVMRA